MTVQVSAGRHGPFPGVLDQERIAAYAGATGDPTRAVQAGETVPAVFPIILAFEAQEAAGADLPGETLDTWAQLSAVRTSRAGTKVVVHFEQMGSDGRVAVEQSVVTHGRLELGL